MSRSGLPVLEDDVPDEDEEFYSPYTGGEDDSEPSLPYDYTDASRTPTASEEEDEGEWEVPREEEAVEVRPATVGAEQMTQQYLAEGLEVLEEDDERLGSEAGDGSYELLDAEEDDPEVQAEEDDSGDLWKTATQRPDIHLDEEELWLEKVAEQKARDDERAFARRDIYNRIFNPTRTRYKPPRKPWGLRFRRWWRRRRAQYVSLAEPIPHVVSPLPFEGAGGPHGFDIEAADDQTKDMLLQDLLWRSAQEGYELEDTDREFLKTLETQCRARRRTTDCTEPCHYIGIRGMPFAGCTAWRQELPALPPRAPDRYDLLELLYGAGFLAVFAVVVQVAMARISGRSIAEEEALLQKFTRIQEGPRRDLAPPPQTEQWLSENTRKFFQASVASLGAVALEEAFFRGEGAVRMSQYLGRLLASLLPERFDDAWVSRICVVGGTAVFFALAHVIGKQGSTLPSRLQAQFIYTFVLGVMTMSLRMRYRSITTPIILHFFFNFLMFQAVGWGVAGRMDEFLSRRLPDPFGLRDPKNPGSLPDEVVSR